MTSLLTSNAPHIQLYSPEISIGCLFKQPSSEAAAQITANITDEFGKIRDATLHYAIGCPSISCQDGDWQHKKMNLIWGNLSKGTFSGIIPPTLQGNTTVNYFIKVIDDLSYSKTTNITRFVTKSESDHKNQSFMVGWYYNMLSNGSIVLEAEIIDSGIGVKNIILRNGNINSEMHRVGGDRWDGLYKVTLRPLNPGKCQCVGSIYDLMGKPRTEVLDPRKKSDSIIHGKFEIDVKLILYQVSIDLICNA